MRYYSTSLFNICFFCDAHEIVKAAVAAKDYVRIAEHFKSLDREKKSYKNVVASAYYYLCAAENFRKASLDDDAQKYAYYAEKIFKTR